MKFSDGNWLIQPGLEIIPAVQAFKPQPQNEELKIYASPRDLTPRYAQLDVPILTVHFSSPLEDVIRVRVYRHKGGRKRTPEFSIFHDEDVKVNTGMDGSQAYFTSGQLTASVGTQGNWSVDFHYQGRRITGSAFKALGHVTDTKIGKTYMKEELDLGVGECIYGLGERFTPFVKNGQAVDIWNQDGGTSTEQAYKNIPFYLSNQGYGVFVNHPELVSFEIASEKVSKVQFSVEGEELEYYIIAGRSPKEVLSKYTTLTGKPALPPAWSFGLWLTTSFTTNYDEETVSSFIDGMAERALPLHVFHFDCFWMEALQWTDFTWDPNTFPAPEAMLQRLKEKGLKICVWINPYIAQASKLFDEAMEKGYLLKKPNGDIWQWDRWQPGMGIVDFTNPAACEWYAGHLRRLIAMGVDSFKTDFGERIPTDVVYYDGSDPMKMHNYYSHLYNQVVFEVLESELGKGEAAVFARSATAGGQRFPVHWGGDCFASYESMAESLRGGLSLGLSGFGFWSHDIGGFESTAPAHVYKRWLAFGLLSSHSRLHGNVSYRVPWLFDEEAVDVTRFFTQLKCRLMPYLFATSVDASMHGYPVMRAMLLEFADDPTCHYLDRQYMLGDSLLVAPVFSEDGEVLVYLPEGTWTHLLTGERAEGGKWRKEIHDFMSLPLYVREGSLLALGREHAQVDYDYANDVELHLFALAEGHSSETAVYNRSGESELKVRVERLDGRLHVQTQGAGKPWSLIMRGVHQVGTVEGAAVEQMEIGVRLIPDQASSSWSVELA